MFTVHLSTDRPITYLFNTLHFYEKMLRDRKSLKKKLVSLVIGSLDGVRPKFWALSEQYLQNTDISWNPDLTYYTTLIKRLSDSKYFFGAKSLKGLDGKADLWKQVFIVIKTVGIWNILHS